MGKFIKGKVSNPNGRPKGSLNRENQAAKEAFITVMELLEARMLDNDSVIGKLTPSRAAELYVGLLNYKKPKLNKNDNINSGDITITVKYDDSENNNDSDDEKPNELT